MESSSRLLRTMVTEGRIGHIRMDTIYVKVDLENTQKTRDMNAGSRFTRCSTKSGPRNAHKPLRDSTGTVNFRSSCFGQQVQER
jgi:hypothetical protein